MLPMRTQACCGILLACAGFFAARAQSAVIINPGASLTYIVTKLADTDDGNCDKDCSLREAIAAAAPGSTVGFAPGLGGTIALKSTLTIGRNLILNGPATACITVSGSKTVRVFHIESGANVRIRNLTIADGSVKGKPGSAGKVRAPGATGDTAQGAGLINEGGVVTVENCTFLNNTVKGGSGGRGGFAPNQYAEAGAGGRGGDGLGGGVYNSGKLFLVNSTFSGNRAIGGTGGDGGVRGGIEAYLLPGAPDANAEQNTAASGMNAGPGGPGGNGYGGAVFSSSDVRILSCTFAGNSALAGKGGMGAAPQKGVNISRGGNRPNGLPGAGLGGAIYRPGALPSGNYAHLNTSDPVRIKNTLIAGNASSINCEAAIHSEGYNISSDDTCHLTASGDRVVVDITLKPIAYNGGSAFTYALPALSPAVDGGDPAGCTDPAGAVLATDQRGQNRAWGGRCDIGAFELIAGPR